LGSKRNGGEHGGQAKKGKIRRRRGQKGEPWRAIAGVNRTEKGASSKGGDDSEFCKKFEKAQLFY